MPDDADAPSPDDNDAVRVPGQVRQPHLLVVDDLPIMGRVVKRMLAGQFEVTAVTSARDIMDLLDASPHGYDIVLTDLMMPGVTGLELAAWMRVRHPDCFGRLVIMTGSLDDPHVRQALSDLDRPCVGKPFCRVDLLRALDGIALSR